MEDARQVAQSHFESWKEAFNRGDAKGIASLYTQDAIHSGGMIGKMIGPEQIAAGIEKLIKTGMKIDGRATEARMIKSDTVVCLGDFRFTGSDHEINGRWSAALIKDNDQWKSALHMNARD